jgi:hypothetical protein
MSAADDELDEKMELLVANLMKTSPATSREQAIHGVLGLLLQTRDEGYPSHDDIERSMCRLLRKTEERTLS